MFVSLWGLDVCVFEFLTGLWFFLWFCFGLFCLFVDLWSLLFFGFCCVVIWGLGLDYICGFWFLHCVFYCWFCWFVVFVGLLVCFTRLTCLFVGVYVLRFAVLVLFRGFCWCLVVGMVC